MKLETFFEKFDQFADAPAKHEALIIVAAIVDATIKTRHRRFLGVRPPRVALVGHGSGVTAGAITRYPIRSLEIGRYGLGGDGFGFARDREGFLEIRDTLQTMRQHRLRTFLTMFGIAWGIAAIIFMMAIGDGFKIGYRQSLAAMGTDIAILWGGRTRRQAGDQRAGRRPLHQAAEVSQGLGRDTESPDMKTKNRRSFLKLTAAAMASAAFLPHAQAAASKRNFRKAIMYSTIGMKGTVLEKFRAMKEAGFEGVEPMGGLNRDEVLAAFKATGLQAAGVCCHTHWMKPLSAPDEATRRMILVENPQRLFGF